MPKLEHEDEKGKRRSYEDPCSWSVLCKEDKDQLDRIEEKLDKLLNQSDNKEG